VHLLYNITHYYKNVAFEFDQNNFIAVIFTPTYVLIITVIDHELYNNMMLIC